MKNGRRMIDNHVHVGWYSDGYHSPIQIWKEMRDAGIEQIAVSSTSTCAELYKLVVQEMRCLIRLGGENVHPILWVTPRMLKTWGIRYMLHSKIHWQGLKMHWAAHREWYYNKKLTNVAIDIAQKMNIPVLLHTGESKECQPFNYETICKEHSNTSFIFAHGRPISQTIEVMKHCNNVYVDTAFMPVGNVIKLVHEGFLERILFGTDIPINTLFYNKTSSEYAKDCLKQLSTVLNKSQFEIITNKQIYKSHTIYSQKI